ncbi:MAG: hypothetical protein HY304_10065 [candidate division Zixibacteria bacterium]|nr:hypothetical protein [candidate division Zixibacteria bacterium]
MKRQRRNPWLLGVTILTAVLALAFLLPGCGENPVSSVSDDPGGHGGGIKGLQYADGVLHPKGTQAASASLSTVDTVVQLVSSSGGTIYLTTGKHASTLVIPKDALASAVLISAVAAEVMTPYGAVTLYDFGPDGLVFAKASRLTLQVDIPDGSPLSLYWWNPATGIWELQQTAKVAKGKVTFDILHFSQYGIG